MQYLVVEDITAAVPIVSDDCILLSAERNRWDGGFY